MVDVLLEVAAQRADSKVQRNKAEDVVYVPSPYTAYFLIYIWRRYRMFEINMDEYLDEEIDSLKNTLEIIVRTYTSTHTPSPSSPKTTTTPGGTTRFLSSHNPALVKRNLLASFTDVLLLPVTIVPRTVGAAVGAALTTGGTAAAQGIAMLNPQRWAGAVGAGAGNGYSRELGRGEDVDADGGMLFDDAAEEDEDTFVNGVKDESALSVPCTYPPSHKHSHRLTITAFIQHQQHPQHPPKRL
jgi:recyclin-1